MNVFSDGLPLGQDGHGQGLRLFLAEALVDAGLWQQLDLAATLVNPVLGEENLTSSNYSIVIDIRHATSKTDSKRPLLHQLGLGVAPADIKPPQSVEVVGLQNVTIMLDFQRTPEDGMDLDKQTDPETVAFLVSMASCSTTFESLFADDENLLFDEEPWSEEYHVQQSQDAAIPWLSSERTESSAKFLDNDEAIGLMDAAVRLCICSKPNTLAPGVTLINDERITTLADIAPAIWLPGYLLDVSQRACLMPTVGRALSKLSIGNVSSTHLTSKLHELANSTTTASRTQGCANVQQKSLSNSQDIPCDMLQAKLWTLMQRKLLQKDGARNIKPIRPSKKADTLSVDVNAEIGAEPKLEEALDHDERSTSSLNNVPESLISMEQESVMGDIQSTFDSMSLLETPRSGCEGFGAQSMDRDDASSQFSSLEEMERMYDSDASMLEECRLSQRDEDNSSVNSADLFGVGILETADFEEEDDGTFSHFLKQNRESTRDMFTSHENDASSFSERQSSQPSHNRPQFGSEYRGGIPHHFDSIVQCTYSGAIYRQESDPRAQDDGGFDFVSGETRGDLEDDSPITNDNEEMLWG